MEIIIIIIAIIGFIIKAQKRKDGQNSKPSQPPASSQTVQNKTRRETVPNQPRTTTVPKYQGSEAVPNQLRTERTATRPREEIWTRLSEESKAEMLGRNTYQQMPQNDLPRKSIEEDVSAVEQIQRRRIEARNTSILDRAIGNNEGNAKDVTLDTMEAEHNHSERVAPAIHHHPEDNLEESMLGSVADLMVKGYDGNLCFERDFLGEAMDMIGRFTVPSEIPSYRGDK